MIVITRNGKTRVYTGWREWVLLSAGFLVCWLILAVIAFVLVGAALTLGITLLLLLPAGVVVAVLKSMLRR